MDVTSPVGWGVLAPGRIAEKFAADLALVPDARLVGTGSRSRERAEAFAARHGGAAHGSYDDLLADPAIDVVYIASPHSLHVEHTLMALDAGKAVLCEKPMTLDADSAAALFEEATRRGLFCMEAMWTACHPTILTLLERLRSGEHGVPRQVHADLGFVADGEPTDREFDPALGAGALLDMGIYPLTLAHLVLGDPEQLTAVAHRAESGVDLDVAIAGRYPGGATAALTASMTAHSPRTATVATTTGRFDLPVDFHHPDHLVWTPTNGAPVRIDPATPIIGQGYGNEILEVHRCLHRGLLSSPLVPPQRTLAMLGQLDGLRAQLGIRYPGEAASAPRPAR